MPNPPPPLSISRPATAAELKAAIEYANWLAEELVDAARTLGDGPRMFAHLLLIAAGATVASIHGQHETLHSLFEAVGKWAAARPSGVAGMTCGDAVAARVSSAADPRRN